MSPHRSSSSARSPASRSSSACRSAGCATSRPRPRRAERARHRHPALPALGRPLGRRSSPIEAALDAARDWGRFAGLRRCSAAGFTLGLDESRLLRPRGCSSAPARAPLVGPGAAALDEFARRSAGRPPARRRAARAADRDRDRRAQLRRRAWRSGRPAPRARSRSRSSLIIGFGLHNATEGFGIVGPMSGERDAAELALPRPPRADRRRADVPRHRRRPGVGRARALAVVFFAVAAGSILYVVQELFARQPAATACRCS